MVYERARPRMQHREDADGAAKIVRIGGERLQRLRRRLHQRPKQYALMGTHDRAHLGRQREHHREGGHRQQRGLARGEPRARTHAVTRRTTAIPARVIDVVFHAARVALRDVPAPGDAPGRYTVAIRVFTVACSALVTIGVIGVYTAVVAGR